MSLGSRTLSYWDKELSQFVLNLSPREGLSFLISDSMYVLLLYLNMNVIWHLATSLLYLSPVERRQSPSAAAQDGYMWANCPELAAKKDLPTIEYQCPQLEMILLFLPWMSKALLYSVLDCIVFSLASLMPRCSGQKCSGVYSRW